MTSVAIAATRQFSAAAQRTTTLYELSEAYVRVLDLLEDPDADQELLEAELDRIAGAITAKAEAIAGLVAHLDGLASIRKAEAQRLKDRATADEHKAQRLRAYLLGHMQAIGTERIDTARFTISVRLNPPAVSVLAEPQVPAEFLRTVTTMSVDKRAVLDAYKRDGVIPEGCDISRSTRLDIR
ncbi:MAG TPA: siphovirus Gp157 family protein [Chloroflexota bacterium]|jgi:hypothetical protein